MEITKEEVDKFIDENWNQCFYKALADHLKNTLLDNNEKKDYREEIKQLIWEGVSNGIKDFLSENYDCLIKQVAREMNNLIEINIDFKRK